VVAVIWLVVILVVVVVLVVLALAGGHSQQSAASYQTRVELHAVHRRFDVGQLKSELRRDAADARRALRAELNKLDGEG
jgi:uncharacterized membrane protein